MPCDPGVDQLEERGVERESEGGGDASAPKEGCREQPGTFTLPPIEEPEQGNWYDGKQARERERLQKHACYVRRYGGENAQLQQHSEGQNGNKRRTDDYAHPALPQRGAGL